MLVNISYNNRTQRLAIEEAVGRSFSFYDRMRLGGIGSPKMNIDASSPEIDELLGHDGYLNRCQVELRPKGIILRFRSLLETYALVIPYWQLSIYQNGAQISLHARHHFVRLSAVTGQAKLRAFLLKLMKMKESFSAGGAFP